MADELPEMLTGDPEPSVPPSQKEHAPKDAATGTTPPAELAADAAPEPAATDAAADEEPLLQPCNNCGTALNVTDLEPFAKVHCPSCGTAIRARTQLKNFTLVEVLGAGGMGAVYKALDTNLDRMVALKVVRKEFSADAEYLAKFEREARLTASVNHPNVVKVYSFGSDHGLFYIAMELVDKGSLDDLMNLQGRVAEIQALNVGIQVAQGLQAAHQKGLIHRDVKPGNILFADAQTSKIVDFGLALLAEHEADARGEVWGTPYYVAPEKLDHQPEDFRGDMYSLGGTLFHAIAGRPPFEADTASMVALKHLKSKAVSLQAFAPDVSSATAFVINRTLNKDPGQRYQSYAEMIEHMEYAKSQLMQASAGPRRPRQRVIVQGAKVQKAAGLINLAMIALVLLAGASLYIFRDPIFGKSSAPGDSSDGGEAASQQLHDQFDSARQQIVAGDYNGALANLKKLDDSDVIAQPLQNWVTLNRAMIALLQDNGAEAQRQFGVVSKRGKFSNNKADADMVDFFLNVAGAMSTPDTISLKQGNQYPLDTFQAMAPFLFALKDWSMGKFSDAGDLLQLYLVSTPKDPFGWIADYRPIAQKYEALAGPYDKVARAVAAANTPELKTAALKQVQDLESREKGQMAAPLKLLEDQLNGITHSTPSPTPEIASTGGDDDTNTTTQPSATPDNSAELAAQKQHDETLLAPAKREYATDCVAYRFTDALAAVQAVTVTNPDIVKEKEGLLKKIDWLTKFKAQLIALLNTYDFPYALGTSSGAQLPAGRKTASDTEMMVQTQFGAVSFPLSSFRPADLLTIANYYSGKMAPTAPQQAADLQWLSGVFAYEEGMPEAGRKLMIQAAAIKTDYKENLALFPETTPSE